MVPNRAKHHSNWWLLFANLDEPNKTEDSKITLSRVIFKQFEESVHFYICFCLGVIYLARSKKSQFFAKFYLLVNVRSLTVFLQWFGHLISVKVSLGGESSYDTKGWFKSARKTIIQSFNLLLTHVRWLLDLYRNQSIDLQCKLFHWFLYDCNIGS